MLTYRPSGDRQVAFERISHRLHDSEGVGMFYAWPEVRFWLVAVGVFIISAASFYKVRTMRALIRIPTRIVSILTSFLSFVAMSLALLVLVSGCNSHLEPLLSPSGDKAARVETDDEGATGGHSWVVAVYSHHGFSVHTVMYGTWRGVDRDDLRWIGDSALEIKYDGPDPSCSDTSEVHVICIRRSEKLR
jgi:hypothetical protein